MACIVLARPKRMVNDDEARVGVLALCAACVFLAMECVFLSPVVAVYAFVPLGMLCLPRA